MHKGSLLTLCAQTEADVAAADDDDDDNGDDVVEMVDMSERKPRRSAHKEARHPAYSPDAPADPEPLKMDL